MRAVLNEIEKFSIGLFKRYHELPFEVLDNLPFAVYIIDYNWVYLFLNENSRAVFGDFAETLIGKNALEVFRDPKFMTIFDKIMYAVEHKTSCRATIYSPLRGKQIKLSGYPLEDCYYFSTVILPSKAEVLEELTTELKRKKKRST